MSDTREHSYIPKLKQQFAEGKCDRREFLRTATLLGMSAGAAYAFAGKVTGGAGQSGHSEGRPPDPSDQRPGSL